MFTCAHCDAQHLKWSGRCTQCQKWGTLLEESSGRSAKASLSDVAAAELVGFGDATANATRFSCGVSEWDRVLEGGLVPGHVALLSGEPGIGKSTLIAHLASGFAPHGEVFYVAGEESPAQLKMRFERLKAPHAHIKLITDTHVEAVVAAAAAHRPALLMVDSIQSLSTFEHDGAAGGPTHLRAATAQLVALAKQTDIPVIIVGQVTKDGSVAGPKLLEHMVDTVLEFRGDTRHHYRLLRATKHRFGSTHEVGVFEMTQDGLVGIANPSDVFLDHHESAPGTAITCTLEGARAFLVEVQALVNPSSYGTPVRRANGFSTNRLQMLLAILEKHGKISFAGQDVFVNVVGGMTLREPSTDLAVCAALVSSRTEKALLEKTVLYGEVGLGGEVRTAPQEKRRAAEAKRLGFPNVVSAKDTPNVRALVERMRPQELPLRVAKLEISK
ncbi:DNA repair protein RadA [Candidatus Uhrbacteria bacterium RIFCSPHIGHO2_02_FULL_53_13]|uniref:DNA repair protein RadA n=1 Tax=Candidatus Uhrbacteria bacterium RIFCSPHIGHO2_02_FULL_53_13 TaxID=1802389 RepID=A0A1F7TWW1_9BACT|nr:MAG: DNA repair protein RadA [Candidatus Uhrbacteria bacterium RIFCSPHIGHO2_02_FULL_53_13]